MDAWSSLHVIRTGYWTSFHRQKVLHHLDLLNGFVASTRLRLPLRKTPILPRLLCVDIDDFDNLGGVYKIAKCSFIVSRSVSHFNHTLLIH